MFRGSSPCQQAGEFAEEHRRLSDESKKLTEGSQDSGARYRLERANHQSRLRVAVLDRDRQQCVNMRKFP